MGKRTYKVCISLYDVTEGRTLVSKHPGIDVDEFNQLDPGEYELNTIINEDVAEYENGLEDE